MAWIEIVIGVAVIIGALSFGWAARPSAGLSRRVQSHPVMEPYFPIVIIVIIMIGIGSIMVGLGITIGQN